VRRIVVTGSECTGKTTLARELASRLDAVLVPEYARQFVAEKGAPPDRSDVEAIARGQMALEDRAAGGGGSLLIQDTDLLSTVIYARHYYGECPRWIEAELARRSAELYLLAGIDVPWTPDGDQRDRGHMREEMQALFHGALVERNLRFVEVQGTLERRVAQASLAINRLRFPER
jgi:NadR type nicotinamide-nucleotide adenylyltransferase